VKPLTTPGRAFFLLQTYRPISKEHYPALNSKPPNCGQVLFLKLVIQVMSSFQNDNNAAVATAIATATNTTNNNKNVKHVYSSKQYFLTQTYNHLPAGQAS
jgi:hypothetical protein